MKERMRERVSVRINRNEDGRKDRVETVRVRDGERGEQKERERDQRKRDQRGRVEHTLKESHREREETVRVIEKKRQE